MTVEVHGDGRAVWLVLGQSQSRGWKATTSHGVALGSSTLIDGYANGWYLPGRADPGYHHRDLDLDSPAGDQRGPRALGCHPGGQPGPDRPPPG